MEPPDQVHVLPNNGEDMLQSIPGEILAIILRFCDMPSLLCFGDTNTTHQRLVYQNSPWLWKDIDFGKLPQAKAGRISDESLAALLTAINAREVTTSLSLMGCTSIRGSGLEPLRGSQCLEVIELRRTHEEVTTMGETGLDDILVIGILSSMSPIGGERRNSLRGLKIVKFRKQHGDSESFLDSFSETIKHFYIRRYVSIAVCVNRNDVLCSKCNGTLDDFVHDAHSGYCSQCKSLHCSKCDLHSGPCFMC